MAKSMGSRRSARTAGSIRLARRAPNGKLMPLHGWAAMWPFDDAAGRERGIKSARAVVEAWKAETVEVCAAQWAILEYTAGGKRRGQIPVEAACPIPARSAPSQVCAAAAAVSPPAAEISEVPAIDDEWLAEVYRAPVRSVRYRLGVDADFRVCELHDGRIRFELETAGASVARRGRRDEIVVRCGCSAILYIRGEAAGSLPMHVARQIASEWGIRVIELDPNWARKTVERIQAQARS